MTTLRCEICGSSSFHTPGSPICLERCKRNAQEIQTGNLEQRNAIRATRNVLKDALAVLGPSSGSYTSSRYHTDYRGLNINVDNKQVHQIGLFNLGGGCNTRGDTKTEVMDILSPGKVKASEIGKHNDCGGILSPGVNRWQGHPAPMTQGHDEKSNVKGFAKKILFGKKNITPIHTSVRSTYQSVLSQSPGGMFGAGVPGQSIGSLYSASANQRASVGSSQGFNAVSGRTSAPRSGTSYCGNRAGVARSANGLPVGQMEARRLMSSHHSSVHTPVTSVSRGGRPQAAPRVHLPHPI